MRSGRDGTGGKVVQPVLTRASEQASEVVSASGCRRRKEGAVVGVRLCMYTGGSRSTPRISKPMETDGDAWR